MLSYPDPWGGFFYPTLTLMIDPYNHECEGGIENSAQGSHIWHHEAWQ